MHTMKINTHYYWINSLSNQKTRNIIGYFFIVNMDIKQKVSITVAKCIPSCALM